ncbi:MAG: hypothetical protein NC311_10855 [Muribaculaceae bacterium]|nr:hypothetical protein [Muribaculaceae bacterium]
MDKETLFKYAPIALVVATIFIQCNLFVTPEKLEIKHREILQDIAQRYTTKSEHDDLKNQLGDMQKKIDKIYDILSNK